MRPTVGARREHGRTFWRIPSQHCVTVTSRGFAMSKNIAAHKHRTRLHVLRDRVRRAKRSVKRRLAGAPERLAAHRTKRAEYRAAHP
jgi:hypothetical protein